MSRIFYDQLIALEKVEKKINQIIHSHQEKLEIWEIIDNLLHRRILIKILEILPEKHQPNFLLNFNQNPYDPSLLQSLKENSPDTENRILNEANNLTQEILETIKSNQH